MAEQDSRSRAGKAGPAKQNPVKQSCDLCKRMKIRCDWQGDSCKHCVERRMDCSVTIVPKQKRTVKRTEYLAAIENRIKQMEAAINATGLSPKLEEPASIVDQIGGQARLSDKMSMLLIGEEGASQFFGASSGFSLFSPHGLRWISDKIGASDSQHLIKAIDGRNKTRGNLDSLFWRSRSDYEQQPLPSKEVADEYVNAYFHVFNTIFPVFEETRFRLLYRRQYSVSPPMGVAWYACINAVLALGSAVAQDHVNKGTATSFVETNSFSGICWTYFRNASSKFTDLMFEAGEIMAIQAILCMALMCQVIPDPHPCYILTATAARLSHSIGLHRSFEESGLSPAEMKERQNVLWITYILDAGLSLRTGRPPAMSDQNIAINLPTTVSEGYDHFRCMATLALLEARAYSELYSADAATRSALERLKSIGRLDTELEHWRDTLPEGYRPERPVSCPDDQLLLVVMLHFAYYNCLTTIHRASIFHESWTSESSEKSSNAHDDGNLNPRVYVSSFLCLEAARHVISLLKHFDRQFPRDGIIWVVIYYPLSAALMLFANALQNPRSEEAFSDIELMGVVVAFLNQLKDSSNHLDGTIKILTELSRIAGRLVRDTQVTRLNSLKRRYEETDDTENLSSSSTKPSTKQLVSTESSGDLIQSSTGYLYDEHVPVDQGRELDSANDSPSLDPDFLYYSSNTWTEAAFHGVFTDGNGWYI